MFLFNVSIDDMVFNKEEIEKFSYIFDPLEDNISLYQNNMKLELDINLISNPNDKELINNNKNKLIHFITWINNFKKTEYKTLKLNMMFNDVGDSLELIFEDVYLDSIKQDFSNEKIGIYSLIFKQKYNKEKENIKIGVM